MTLNVKCTTKIASQLKVVALKSKSFLVDIVLTCLTENSDSSLQETVSNHCTEILVNSAKGQKTLFIRLESVLSTTLDMDEIQVYHCPHTTNHKLDFQTSKGRRFIWSGISGRMVWFVAGISVTFLGEVKV